MELSVIVPFVNEYPQVIFTLQAIAEDLLGRVDFEVIAVDNYAPEVEEMAKKDPNQPSIYTRDKGGDVVKGSQRAAGGWLNMWSIVISCPTGMQRDMVSLNLQETFSCSSTPTASPQEIQFIICSDTIRERKSG